MKSETQKVDNDVKQLALLGTTTRIVSAYVSANTLPISELAGVVKAVHQTVSQLTPQSSSTLRLSVPAVPVKKSVTDEYIICLEDGRKLRTLKRFLRTQYGMSPDEYRAKWRLPSDYPMVAPAYAKLRSAFARKIGLGRAPSKRR